MAPTQSRSANDGRTERPLHEDIEDEAPDEGPDETRFETDRHRDDDPDDEDQMRLRRPDPEVRADGQFEQGHHRRTDRGEQQGHRSGSILGDVAKVAPARTVPRGVGRTAATSRRSIPRTRDSGQRTAASVRPWVDGRRPVSRETREADESSGAPGSLFHVKRRHALAPIGPRVTGARYVRGERPRARLGHAPAREVERPAMVESCIVRRLRAGH